MTSQQQITVAITGASGAPYALRLLQQLVATKCQLQYWCPALLVWSLKRDNDNLMDTILAHAHPGDHILIMSNGGFANIHEKLLKRLQH